QRNLVRAANRGGDLVGLIAGLAVGLGKHHLRLDGLFYFLEGFGMGVLFIQHFDDVEPVLRLDQARELALIEAESGLFKFGHGLAELIDIDESVTNDALFRDLVFALVFIVSGLDFRLIWSNFGFQIFRFDNAIVELDLFVAILEFILELAGSNADPVGDQLAELVGKEFLPNGFLKNRDGHLKTRLDLSGVLVLAYETVAVVGGRKELANAVGKLFIRNANAQETGFVLNLLLENEGVEDLM